MPYKSEKSIELIIGHDADKLEQFAALELQSYLKRLFGVTAKIGYLLSDTAEYRVILGNPQSNPIITQVIGKADFPQLSDQGFLLRKTMFMDKPTMVISGGSPAAVMWGVYELVEHYGVRYLLHGDVYPENAGEFRLPEIDRVWEPLLRVRWWRVINDFAMGPESWGMADYQPVLDQLAKLKFNRIGLSTWPWQPFLHLEIKGIKRKSAALWFNFHYPITDDMPGRELFGDEEEFWNPDLPAPRTARQAGLPRGASYEEFVAAGERLCHELIAYAKSRGMQASFSASVMDFPEEFRPIIPDAQTVHQLGNLTVGPGPKVMPDDPDLLEVASAVLKTAIDTYPDADFYAFGMPEHRAWTERYEWAWQQLNEKYQISQIISLEQVLQKAQNRTSYPGGAQRAVTEVKGDIAALYFFDRMLTSPDVLLKSRKPDARVVITGVAEELFPILHCILPKGSEALIFVDYTASRVVRRREALRDVPAREIPASLIFTLHDDNVGVLPQLVTSALHELACDLRKHGWSGFSTRYWMISDHDPCVAYLSKTAWDANATPETVYADQIRAVCGDAAVKPMLEAFRELEAVTVALEDHGLGLTFPVPSMIMKHWVPGSLSSELAEDREGYRRALSAVRKVPEPPRPEGKAYINYWIGRLQFGIGYIDTIEAVRKAATAEQAAKDAKEKEDDSGYRARLTETIEQTKAAVETARQALEAFANVAKNQSDRGAIATMAEYVYRPLKQKVQSYILNA
jgi:hypothetical protein